MMRLVVILSMVSGFILEGHQARAQNSSVLFRKTIERPAANESETNVLTECDISGSGKVKLTKSVGIIHSVEWRDSRFSNRDGYKKLKKISEALEDTKRNTKHILAPILPLTTYFATNIASGEEINIAHIGKDISFIENESLRTMIRVIDALCDSGPNYGESSFF